MHSTRRTRLAAIGATAALLVVPFAGSAANANGGGVGEPTVATDEYRTVSSVGNYALVRGPAARE